MTRKPDDWMPLHIGKYLADTTHLTRDQHGAYLLLLMAYWRRGAPLPADDSRLAATAKATPAEWRKLKPILAEFFTVESGCWVQKKAEEELAKANAMTQAKAEAGKKGAEKRWQRDGTANSTAMAVPSRSQRQTDAPIPSPEPEHLPSGDNSSLRSEDAGGQSDLGFSADEDAAKSPKKPPISSRSEPVLGQAKLPPFVPVTSWSAFVDMRRRIRAPLTPRAIELMIGKLQKLHDQGEDIGAVIDQSILKSWRDVFPVKRENGGSHAGNGSRAGGGASHSHQAHLEGLAMLVDEADGRSEDLSERGQLTFSAGDDGFARQRTG